MDNIRVFYEKVTYESEPEIIVMSREEFEEWQKESEGKPIICRIATEKDEAEYKDVLWRRNRAAYDAAIAKKYDMPLDWRENRWFVEQVRPTLY